VLRLAHPGFLAVEMPMRITGEPMIQDVTMNVAGFGDDVVVTASRSAQQAIEVPASVTRQAMDTLENNGFYAAADEFRGQPGVFFRRGEGDNEDFLFVNLRGVTGNHGNDTFLALIDGIPFIDGNEEVPLSDVPYDAVGEIEIVRGPVSALYGRGGIAGAVNYFTKSVGRSGALARLEAGSGGFAKGVLSFDRAWGERHQFMGSVAGLYGEGWREQNQRDSINVFAKQVTRVGTASALSLWGNYLDKQYETGSAIPLLPDGTMVAVTGGRDAFYGSKDTSSARRMAWTAGRFQHPVTPRVSLESTLHYRRTKTHSDLDFYDSFGFQPGRNVMTVNGFDAEVNESAVFAEGVATVTLPAARVIVGGNVERTAIDEIDRWSGQDGFTFACGFTFSAIEIDYATGAVLNRNHPCFKQDLVRTIADTTNRFGSLFGQVDLSLGSRTTLTLGGRYDRFTRHSEISSGDPLTAKPPVDRTLDKFNPKASLTVNLGASQVAYAAFGQGFSTNFGPAWQWDPARYIRREKPTTLRNYEAGVKGNIAGSAVSYALSAYRIDQRDRLIFVSNPNFFFGSGLADTIATTGQRYESTG
jgi:iron complex outermembrane receptor protein